VTVTAPNKSAARAKVREYLAAGKRAEDIDMKDLAGKVALITGAASGIGRASALSVARRGGCGGAVAGL